MAQSVLIQLAKKLQIATRAAKPLLTKVGNSSYNKFFEVFMPLYRQWAKKNMALADLPETHHCFPIAVTKVEDIAPHLRRITVKAQQFLDWTPSGVDEYFGLVIAPEGKRLVLPSAEDLNIRGALNEINEELRPNLRWYTIRSFNKKEGTCTFDIVTHGRSGPGSRWALDAAVGTLAGFRTITATWKENNGPQLLVGDSTSAPAIWAILEHASKNLVSKTSVIITAPNDEYLEPGYQQWAAKLAHFEIIYSDIEQAHNKVSAAMRALGNNSFTYAWLCGEASIAKECRRVAVKEWGMEKTSVLFSGYWRKDRAHG